MTCIKLLNERVNVRVILTATLFCFGWNVDFGLKFTHWLVIMKYLLNQTLSRCMKDTFQDGWHGYLVNTRESVMK